MTYMCKALICKQYYRRRFHFLCSVIQITGTYWLTLPTVIRTNHEIPPFMYWPVPDEYVCIKLERLWPEPGPRDSGRGRRRRGPRPAERRSWFWLEERDYRSACTDLRATSTSLLFTYTHSHALPWATAESAMAISTFSMFDPSVGTLKCSCPKNDYFYRNADVKGFPMTYHSPRSVRSPYTRIVPYYKL